MAAPARTNDIAVLCGAKGRRPRSIPDRWLGVHALLLLGYAYLGKGFAYLGLGPLYVGDWILFVGLGVALATRSILRVPRLPATSLLLAWIAWCCAVALMHVSEWGVDTLRDSAIWGYALYAVLIACFLVSRPDRLSQIVARYGSFARCFLWAMPPLWMITNLAGDALPRLPDSPVAILSAKSTDTLVHLAGIACLCLVGLMRAPAWSLPVFGVGFVALSTRSRGAMLGAALALMLVAVMRPGSRRLWRAAAVTGLAIPVLLSLNFGITIQGRELSGRQLLENALSVVDSDVGWRLAGTRQWRLSWWQEIWDYTLHGPYFWTGKGFGVNLARDDGFSLNLAQPLRSPHNANLTVLARAGVPGLALWSAFHAAWVLEMRRRYRAARRNGQHRWSGLFLFLTAYWLAFIVNASFDVALEGPMAGVWFWSVVGVGLGAASIHRYRPWVFETGMLHPPAREGPR